jgi:TatD DNase family protein
MPPPPSPADVPPETIPGLTDTHCHLDLPAFDADRPQVLDRARRAGLTRILIPGIDLPGSRRAAQLARSDPMLRFAAGVHAHESASVDGRALAALRELARAEGAAAIGEIGLDYFRALAPRAGQRQAFRAQIALACELGLPVVFHVRDSQEDALAILSEFAGTVRGVWHAFSGDRAAVERAAAMGFYFGIAGPLTYPKADSLREAVRAVPPERILFETDSPYLPPQGNRGKRNEPALVLGVARAAAGERRTDVGELVQTARRNANLLFAWE